eukprot:86623-Prymnesium_polylepis.2
MLRFGAIVPAEHAVCSELPVGAKNPGSVREHCAALARSVAALNVPLTQGKGADAPTEQNDPVMPAIGG